MQWFRLHAEARNDRKLATLSDAQFRVWFNLLCLASEAKMRGTVTYDDTDLLALEVASGDVELLTETLASLRRLKMIDAFAPGADEARWTPGFISFLNWTKRQYDKPSDTPEETRKRKERSRDSVKEGVTTDAVTPTSRDVTPGHATYTDTEQTQSRTEPEQSREETPPQPPKGEVIPPEFAEFWERYPTGFGSKPKTLAAWKKVRKEHAAIMAGLEAWHRSERWQKGFIKASELWLRDRLWENPPPAPKGEGGFTLPPGFRLPPEFNVKQLQEALAYRNSKMSLPEERERLVDAYLAAMNGSAVTA